MKEAKELLRKYEAGQCTPEEIRLLRKWFHHLGEHEASELTEEDLRIARLRFRATAERVTTPWYGTRRWKITARATAAAVAGLLILAGLHTLFDTGFYTSQQDLSVNHQQGDIAPGTSSAIVTLPNGQSFHVTDADQGSIAEEAGLSVARTADGELVYTVTEPAKLDKSEGGYSVIETPRAAQHQVLLPDGTRVWLNAASSVKFPSTFSLDHERVIELTGEAYFEVARDTKRPFVVKSEHQEVKVLGTSFNINSYKEERTTTTTLIEGSVQIRSTPSRGAGGEQVILVPGSQALLTETGFRIKQMETGLALDWKNGDFIFQQEGLTQILNRVARWYDVEVEYEPGVDKIQTFSGQVSRSKHLSEVLMILEATGQVQFKISGKRIIACK